MTSLDVSASPLGLQITMGEISSTGLSKTMGKYIGCAATQDSRVMLVRPIISATVRTASG